MYCYKCPAIVTNSRVRPPVRVNYLIITCFLTNVNIGSLDVWAVTPDSVLVSCYTARKIGPVACRVRVESGSDYDVATFSFCHEDELHPPHVPPARAVFSLISRRRCDREYNDSDYERRESRRRSVADLAVHNRRQTLRAFYDRSSVRHRANESKRKHSSRVIVALLPWNTVDVSLIGYRDTININRTPRFARGQSIFPVVRLLIYPFTRADGTHTFRIPHSLSLSFSLVHERPHAVVVARHRAPVSLGKPHCFSGV